MTTRYGRLHLDDSPRTLVFRTIDDVIRADPTIRRVCPGKGSIRSWRGDPEDKAEFGTTQAPAIKLTPMSTAESEWYPGASKGGLGVIFEVVTRGLAIDDADNLVYAIERALKPREQADALAVQAKLKTAGAMTGIITFIQPAFDSDPSAGADGTFRAVGQFHIEVRTS